MRSLLILIVFLGILFASGQAAARCYSAPDWAIKGQGFWVCVKIPDTWINRERVRLHCKRIKGANCGRVRSVRTFCYGACYDKSGKRHRLLKGY